MREIDAILSRYNSLKSDGTESVLATVVHVEGSSYRRAGARMLVDAFGNITGAISGGCLEGDALRKALNALNQQENKLITYDTSNEDDVIIGAQLGCNGIIQVLFEPIDYEKHYNPCELLNIAAEQDKSLAIIIRFNLDKSKEQFGTTMLVTNDSTIIGNDSPDDLKGLVLEHSVKAIKNNSPYFVEISTEDSEGNLFIQVYQPPIKLILVGAGNDAQILSQQAELLGWKVIVTDGRPTHANKNRFTSSCQVIVTKPEETLNNISLDDRSCVVLMSHNYNYDLAVLKLLINQEEIPYIGILGPVKKYNRMLEDLKNEGFDLQKSFLNKIHAPVGLEIGAETPAEIGLSILSEIQAVLTGNNARPLKEKDGPIHDKNDNQFKEARV
ncbi:XdhC family protein [Mangrovivirga sp. M17]|uniref:XdhC family protein n=1 Tax=Mangrovivirga halotolerans TaxID=2993936 RepID=A0ABT3RQG0_9BACT|nr:XdhC/CoxI family protein [Mangrovivirga halotolerans]MCX2743850.1 XdhC family protein [Mangrovivirga halotolerans]